MAVEKSAASSATAPIKGPGTSAIASERIPDIAIEVERLCDAVRAAATGIRFSDEPGYFSVMLNNKAR
jgi:hypothetical protein